MGQRESEFLVEELLHVWATALAALDNGSADNLEGLGTDTVTSGHFLVKGSDGFSKRSATELLVHVVCTGTGVVTEPDTKVLDNIGLLFKELTDVYNFTVGSLQVVVSLDKVPEFRLCYQAIGSKDLHSVELALWVLLGRNSTSDHFVLVELLCCRG